MTKSNGKGGNMPSFNDKDFEGSHPDLKGYYYTHDPEKHAVDQFQQTTEKLIEVVCSKSKQAKMLRLCLKTLTTHTLAEPVLGETGPEVSGKKTSSKQDELKYNVLFKNWQTQSENLTDSLEKAFHVILGQCSRNKKSKISEDANWETIDANCDPVGLLTILKGIAHNNETHKDPTVSLIQAEKRLNQLLQGETQMNDSYRIKFENRANVVVELGGALYRRPTLEIVAQKEHQKAFDTLSAEQQAVVIGKATEMWKSRLFIMNACPRRYSQLKKDLHNSYIEGNKEAYPATLNDAYTRLNNYQAFVPCISQNQNETPRESSFAQENNTSESDSSNYQLPNKVTKAPKKWSDWICAVCGKKGHPPSPKYCQVVLDYKKKRIGEESDSSSSRDTKSSRRKKRDKSNGKSKRRSPKSGRSKSKKDESNKEEVKDLLQAALTTLAQANESDSEDSESESDSEDEANSHFQRGFQLFEKDSEDESETNNDSDITDAETPSQKHRSASKPRSGEENEWTLVVRKNKHKHKQVVLQNKERNLKFYMSKKDLKRTRNKLKSSTESSDSDCQLQF